MKESEELERQVLVALGEPCGECTLAVVTLLQAPHDRRALDRAVDTLGHPNRRALARRMQLHGFPAPRELQPWLRCLTLLDSWERNCRCLERQAYDNGVEPVVLRRIVGRITRSSWLAVRDQGLETWLARFAEHVGRRIRGRQVSADHVWSQKVLPERPATGT